MSKMKQLLISIALTFLLSVKAVLGLQPCRERDGMYRNPTDPKKFYRCYSGFRYDFNCPAGLVFDTSLQVCNWPRDVSDIPTPQITDDPAIDDEEDNPAIDDEEDNPVIDDYKDNPVIDDYKDNPVIDDYKDNPVIDDYKDIPHDEPITVPYQHKGSQCKRIVCYITNWSQYRPTENTKFFPTDVDPFLCTHIISTFAKLNGNQLVPFEWNDISSQWSPGNYEKAINLKKQNPALKVLLAVGGWNMGSEPFHKMVDIAAGRTEFVRSAVHFLRAHKFDGLDLDWEYPANRGSPPDDKNKFTLLVQELRDAFNREHSGDKRLLLTAAVAAGKNVIDSAYDIAKITPNIDWFNLMTYDYHGGSFDNFTGHNSPLYADSTDKGFNRYMNLNFSANYWVEKGVPKSKIVIGMPVYGRSFTLTSSNSGLGAPGIAGKNGTYTREAGYLSYYEICEMIDKGGVVHYLKDQRVPYIVLGDQWAGFDTKESLREKVRYVRDNEFGGIMVWTLDLDDFSGTFCHQGKYPLLKALNDECKK